MKSLLIRHQMRSLSLLIILLFLFSCSTEKKESNSSSNAVSKNQLISVTNFKIGDIVDSKYALFDLGTYSEEDPNPIRVKFIKETNDFSIIIFSQDVPCTPIVCPEELEFFLIKNGSIIHRRSESFSREESPLIEIPHNTFIQYLETKHEWFENDNGAMDFDENKDRIDGIRLVILENKLVPLNELSKKDLRIYRNLIFAKYGYRFKSEDLQTHFSEKDWYEAKHDNVDSLLTPHDKELIAYLSNLEER